MFYSLSSFYNFKNNTLLKFLKIYFQKIINKITRLIQAKTGLNKNTRRPTQTRLIILNPPQIKKKKKKNFFDIFPQTKI